MGSLTSTIPTAKRERNVMSNLPPGVSTSDLPECKPRPWRDDALKKLIDGDHIDKFIKLHQTEILEAFADDFPNVKKSLYTLFMEWFENEVGKNPVEDAA